MSKMGSGVEGGVGRGGEPVLFVCVWVCVLGSGGSDSMFLRCYSPAVHLQSAPSLDSLFPVFRLAHTSCHTRILSKPVSLIRTVTRQTLYFIQPARVILRISVHVPRYHLVAGVKPASHCPNVDSQWKSEYEIFTFSFCIAFSVF